MHILERIVKIVITFFIFIVAQALMAASINTLFDLIPLRIDRFFAKSFATTGNEPKKDAKAASPVVDGQQQRQQSTSDVKKEKFDNSLIATKNIVQSFTDTASLVK